LVRWGKGEQRAQEICGTLAAAGYVAVSIDYRLGNRSWPQNLLDCKNAVRFLRAKAAEYHLDPNRIAVAGGSAGGHLALMVGFTTGMAGLEPDAPYPGVSSAVRCIIDMYGPTNLLTRKDIAKDGTPSATRRLMGKSLDYFGAKDEEDPVLKLASPVTHVRRDVPPVMVLHGRADTTVDYHQSDELVRILKEKGAKHEYLLIDGVGHTFAWENWGKKRWSATCVRSRSRFWPSTWATEGPQRERQNFPPSAFVPQRLTSSPSSAASAALA
jgi:acetyl esterase/lipase